MAIKDLESMEVEVRDENTRAMFVEVVRAYRAGARRSALVSLWVTVVVDLTAKIRSLSEQEDGGAKQLIGKLDRAIEQGDVLAVQRFEKSLLEESLKLEILTAREKVELGRLSEDRNLCAHPSFMGQGSLFDPSAELVRSHIVSAFQSSFSQPPIAGKRKLSLLGKEIASNSWPSGNGQEIGSYLEQRFFKHTRDAVKKNMMKILIKNSLETDEENPQVAQRSSEAVHAVSGAYPLLIEGVFSDLVHSWEEAGKLSDEKIYRVISVFGDRRFSWDALPSTAQMRLLEALKEPDIESLVKYNFFAGGDPTDGGAEVAQAEELSRLYIKTLDLLRSNHLEEVIAGSRNKGSFVYRLIRALGNAPNFREAEIWAKLISESSMGLDKKSIEFLTQKSIANDQVVYAAGVEQHFINSFLASSDTELKRDAWVRLVEDVREAGSEGKYGKNYDYSALESVINDSK